MIFDEAAPEQIFAFCLALVCIVVAFLIEMRWPTSRTDERPQPNTRDRL